MRYLQDPDVTLYHGDVLTVLRELPAESVDCCVTSPPYWGLRDYGTGAWEGGDEGCDHLQVVGKVGQASTLRSDGRAHTGPYEGEKATETPFPYRDTCGKCGATRIDQQLGLEPTPEEYVTRMVEVFREVRRVLASHGTVWLNLGDSYSTQMFTRQGKPRNVPQPPKDWAGTELGDRGRAGNVKLVERHDLGDMKAKDLCGIPWMVAFALRADGWYLRSDIIWAKPNPMPESVTDRPTKAHEYVFLLSKQPRYFFDQEAVREAAAWERWGDQTVGPGSNPNGWIKPKTKQELTGGRQARHYDAEHFKTTDERNTRFQGPNPVDGGRNIRSVWEIATQPYPEAHFATFPEELARRCIAAGCPEQVCRVCGKARERMVEKELVDVWHRNKRPTKAAHDVKAQEGGDQASRRARDGHVSGHAIHATTLGFTDCGHADYRPGVALDPFMGSGTVAFVARKLDRHSVGIDLSAEYLELAARRLQQQSLFA